MESKNVLPSGTKTFKAKVGNNKEENISSADQNKSMVRRTIEEIWNKGNFDLISELVDKDFVYSSGSDEVVRGQEGIRQYFASLREAFPDIKFTIEDLVAEGDRVVTKWNAHATHLGTFMGIAPTGKKVTLSGMDLDRIANGKFMECWSNVDRLSFLQQLGVINQPGKTSIEQTQDQWNSIAAGYNEFVTPSHMWLANEGLKRVGIKKGITFLDIAAGTGALSIPAARLGAEVVSIDLSPVMLDLLKERAKTEEFNIDTRVMDGHTLRFEDDTFDVAGSQFGIMLFPDKPRALREMVRVIKPRGYALLHLFGHPSKIEFLGLFIGCIKEVVPNFVGLPMEPLPIPFELHDPERLRQELVRAGLKEVSIDTVTERLEFASPQHLWNWVTNSNPIAVSMISDLSEEQKGEIRKKMELKFYQRIGGGGTGVLTNPVHIAIGRK